jgi:hypothetical protein
MNAIILVLILIIILVIIAIVIWRLIFSNLFQVRSKLSLTIREKIFPDIQKTVNILISLSSAAIVLTFSILQIITNKPILYKSYLITSWISFALTIFFGIGSMVLLYILRAQYMIVVRDVEKVDKEKDIDIKNELGASLDKAQKIEKSFHILLYSQAVTFISAIIFLLIFAITNL